MEAKNINTIEDADRFVEGCLNDLIEGISTKSEIMIQMARYTGRIAELALQKNTNKMTDKLTDNDKQRIEQEAAKLFNRWDGGLVNVQTMLLSIAEYATLYERQQQAKEIDSLIQNDVDKSMRFQQRKAELRNKVIEEAIELMATAANVESDPMFILCYSSVIGKLNSLKTK